MLLRLVRVLGIVIAVIGVIGIMLNTSAAAQLAFVPLVHLFAIAFWLLVLALGLALRELSLRLAL